MQILYCNDSKDASLWGAFVHTHPECTGYHRWNWKSVLERTFHFPTFYLMAKQDGRVKAILPLAWQKSWISASCLCSLPILSSGGIVAEDKEAEQLLLEEAIVLAKKLKVDYLELRNLSDHTLNLPSRTDKVTVVLPVYTDPEKTWAALETKMRTKIRRAIKFGLSAEFGKENFLDEFYEVFAHNMRDLGTPVYSRNLFGEILSAFPESTYVCLIRHERKTVAASFLIGYQGVLEAKWSSSLRQYISLKPNMFLYWNLLSFAGQNGYRRFDFGRSTVGSGTHDFKMQWGGQTIPLHWAYWMPNGNKLPETNPNSAKYRLPIRVWQKLPLTIANQLGPKVVKHFPS